MTGGSANHSRILANIHVALRSLLSGTPCSHFGPDLGIRTIGETVRFPDALITCTKSSGTDRLAPNVVVVFEVLSPDSGRRDRIEKVREYAAVASIRRYVIIETAGTGLFVLHRQQGDVAFNALTLTGEDLLDLPEVGVSLAIAETYEDVAIPAPARDDVPFRESLRVQSEVAEGADRSGNLGERTIRVRAVPRAAVPSETQKRPQ
jgi:Uma2 family endonuclease